MQKKDEFETLEKSYNERLDSIRKFKIHIIEKFNKKVPDKVLELVVNVAEFNLKFLIGQLKDIKDIYKYIIEILAKIDKTEEYIKFIMQNKKQNDMNMKKILDQYII